ncbi:leucine-rich repeat-containing 40 [Chlorella sorokiniana]|uniref:Leucine-rich repeat-containing 40 n=1 Tax=Chlorella sorokiniana TaxID=3076 RepID=A0A2P6TFC7_CHLSO|nr:leucine-rich repeat-containing 40 [Chlorella sorokiniana]|eukprot:PRW32676.1 leucine-rich repeat-containing 40 [Chlorella sorokiniana]
MAAGGGANLLSLPDAVLETICALVLDPAGQPSRFVAPQRHVALACRRLSAAANSPVVLHRGAADARNLCMLQRRSDLQPADWSEAGMLLGSLLQACSALEALELFAKGSFNLTLSSWASGLTSLRRLIVCSHDELLVTADLRWLTELRDMILFAGEEVDIASTCRLPPSLARFNLHRASSLPSQLSALTDLYTLYLTRPFCEPDGFLVLERLSSLQHMHLKKCRLPACLARLTGLRELCLQEGTLTSPNLLSLPDELLETICSLALDQTAQPGSFVRRVAGPHVRQLRLQFRAPAGMEPADWTEAGMLLASLLQACCELDALELIGKGGFNLTLSSWAAGLTSLRRLTMASQGELLVTADLRPLSGLKYLALYTTRAATRLQLDTTCRLPPSLTQLNLQRASHMFEQIGTLSNLEALRLVKVAGSPEDFGVMERLTSLHTLHLEKCRLPACLAGLASLRALAPLRLLAIEGTLGLPPEACASVLEAQRRRPELRILPCADALEEVAAWRRELALT